MLIITPLGWDIPILLVNKLSFRKVVGFSVKGHLTTQWGGWESGLSVKPSPFTPLHCLLGAGTCASTRQLCLAPETLSALVSACWPRDKQLYDNWL